MVATLTGASNQARADEFSKALGHKLRALTVGRAVTAQRKLTLDFLIVVLPGTPVDTGVARGGWHVDVGTLTRAGVRPDRSGNLVRLEAGIKLRYGLDASRPATVVFISNNVPYIEVLERGVTKSGRHWSLRGHGFFQRAIAYARSQLGGPKK